MDHNDLIGIEQTFTTQQVSDTLGIGKSTVNKYSRSLEEHGYSFLKDEKDRRAYIKKDIAALRELKELLGKNTDYDSAIKAICSKHPTDVRSDPVAIPTLPEIPENERYIDRYFDLHKTVREQGYKIDSLIEFNKNAVERMDRQNENLTAILREMLEAKRMIAAAEEKKKWWKFW